MLRLSPVAFGWQQAQSTGRRRSRISRTQAASALVVPTGHDASDHLFHWHRRISRRDQDQHRLMDDKADSPDAPPMFSGTPRKYRRIAWLLAISTHAFLYGGLLLIEYVWRGRAWLQIGRAP